MRNEIDDNETNADTAGEHVVETTQDDLGRSPVQSAGDNVRELRITFTM